MGAVPPPDADARPISLAGRERQLGDIAVTRGALVYEGPFGSGRSALVDAACQRARLAGSQVLLARATSVASEHAFAVALAAVGPETGARALAVAGLDGRSLDTLGAPERTALVRSLAEQVTALAADRPLLLAVDDAHRADGPSLELLAHLGASPELTVLATVRQDAPERRPERLRPLVRVAAAGVLPLPPLDDEAAHELAGRWLEPGRPLNRVLVSCAGNPFLLVELTRAVVAGESSSAGDPVPPPIFERVRAELERLGEEPAAIARALATLEPPVSLSLVAAVAGVGHAEADATVGRLADAGLVDGGPALALTQPLTARAVDASTPARTAVRLHTRAAELLHDAGRSPEEVAAHLLEADRLSRGWAVDALLAAAATARDAKRHDDAVAYGRRALAEPPAAERRVAVVIELARAEADAGLPEAADRLREAMRLASDPDDRARCALRLGQLMMVGGDRAGAQTVLSEAIVGASPAVAPAIVEELRAAQTVVAINDLAVDVDERIAALEDLSPDYASPTERSALAVEAMTGTFLLTLDHEHAIALCRRALTGGGLLREETAGGVALRFVTGTLAVADALDFGLSVTESLIEVERGRNNRLGLTAALYSRSWQHYYRGDVEEACRLIREVLDEAPHDWAYMPPARAVLGLALLELDQPEAAQAAVELEPRPAWRESILWPLLMAAQARVLAGSGRTLEALVRIGELRALEDMTGGRNPALLDRGAIETIARVQARDFAGAREVAERDLELARIWGAPRAVGVALRSVALARLEDDVEAAIALLDESRTVLDASPSALEQARTLVDLGIALRRAGRNRDAREPLAQALHLADERGLRWLARRAGDELAVAGGRPRRAALAGVAALTPAEHRVATLAAEGRTNKAIAAELFVTVKAVEKHLGATYEKLGIRSRRALAEQLAGDDASSGSED